MLPIDRRFTTAAVLFLAANAPAFASDGKIVVTHDDHLLADQGFNLAPDTPTFVRNLTDWFTPAGGGNYLAYSDNFGLTGPLLAQEMANLGHSWTVDRNILFDLPTLLQYDAVFLLRDAADPVVLTDYVQSGGHVYLGGGAGRQGEAANTWNGFLQPFGFAFSDVDNGLNGNFSPDVNHPLFHGVDELYQNNGSNVIDLDTGDCIQRVIWTEGADGLGGVSNNSGQLELHAYSATLMAGDTLELTAGLGLAGKRAVLAVESVNGVHLFIQILLGTFNSDCRWEFETTLPAGLPTADVTIVLYGIGMSGKIEASNPVLLSFP